MIHIQQIDMTKVLAIHMNNPAATLTRIRLIAKVDIAKEDMVAEDMVAVDMVAVAMVRYLKLYDTFYSINK